jgi:hypothetical protein
MYFSSKDARLALEAIEKLIAATECRGALTAAQRDALALQRRSRTMLIELLATRQELLADKIVSFTLWRDGAGRAAEAAPPKKSRKQGGARRYSAAVESIELS